MTLTYKDVNKAYERIKDWVVRTPLEHSFYLNNPERDVFFKLETMQPVKNFKLRGAMNKLLSLNEQEKEQGVAAISSGNHGASVSYGAKLLGMKSATIIVPETTPNSKVEKIKYFGGKVLQFGQNYDECHVKGEEYIKEHNLVKIDSYYDDPLIYAGQGTIAVEILEQNPDIDTIVIPVGGGGLLTGNAVAAKAIKPSIRVIGVQTAACPALIKSYEDNVFYDKYPNESSICDALVGGIGKLCYEMARDYVDEFVAVPESSIRRAVSFMAKEEKYIAEPGSCTTIAAVQDFPEIIGNGKVALIISGANIDGDLLTELLNEY